MAGKTSEHVQIAFESERNSVRECAKVHLKACSFHCKVLKVVHGRKNLPVSSRNETESAKYFKS